MCCSHGQSKATPECPSSSSASSGKSSGIFGNPWIKDFQLIEVVGKGGFGVVMLAYALSGTGFSRECGYAMKSVDKKPERLDWQAREAEALKAVGNGSLFVARLFACFQSTKRVYYVMEYVPDCLDLLLMRWTFLDDEERAKSIFLGLFLGMEHIHQRGFVHHDLKTENILLTYSGCVKIVDFGLATKLSAESSQTARSGTPGYIAPEVLNSEPRAGPAADYWAFGVICYEVLHGDLPYQEGDRDMLEPLWFREELDEDIKSLIMGCLTKDPWERYNAERVRRSNFFRAVDYSKFYAEVTKPSRQDLDFEVDPDCKAVFDKMQLEVQDTEGSETFHPEFNFFRPT